MMSTNNGPLADVNSTVPYRPLGLIKELLAAMNLDITYMYEDLIFVEHNAFLLQMGDKAEEIYVWFNSDSVPADRPEIMAALKILAAPLALELIAAGIYGMQQNSENESFQLEFSSQTS